MQDHVGTKSRPNWKAECATHAGSQRHELLVPAFHGLSQECGGTTAGYLSQPSVSGQDQSKCPFQSADPWWKSPTVGSVNTVAPSDPLICGVLPVVSCGPKADDPHPETASVATRRPHCAPHSLLPSRLVGTLTSHTPQRRGS